MPPETPLCVATVSSVPTAAALPVIHTVIGVTFFRLDLR